MKKRAEIDELEDVVLSSPSKPHAPPPHKATYFNPSVYEFWWDEEKDEEENEGKNSGGQNENFDNSFQELFLSQAKFNNNKKKKKKKGEQTSGGDDMSGSENSNETPTSEKDGDESDLDSNDEEEDGESEGGDDNVFRHETSTAAMWLTNSELMLANKTQRAAEQEEKLEEQLPESIQEILKMNTLNWLKARGKGKKMATEMDRVRMLRDWFEALDADGSGDISVDELEEPLISIGLVSSKQDLEEMINKYDSSGDGEIDFQEFVKMVMTKEEGGQSNAMLKLFEAFSEGKLGDPLLPFSTLVHMYSREKLFSAVMAENEDEKSEGQKVLKARTQRIEAREFEKSMEQQKLESQMQRRRSSMKVALGFTSSQLQKTVNMVLGDNDTKMSADLRERRDSMTMMARRNSVTRVNDLILEEGGLAGLESAIGSPKGSGGGEEDSDGGQE